MSDETSMLTMNLYESTYIVVVKNHRIMFRERPPHVRLFLSWEEEEKKTNEGTGSASAHAIIEIEARVSRRSELTKYAPVRRGIGFGPK